MWASFVDQGLDLTFSSREKVFTSDSMQTHFEISTPKFKLDLVLSVMQLEKQLAALLDK